MALDQRVSLLCPLLSSPTLPPRRTMGHLFSLSTSIVSVSLKLGFSKSFYFELILDIFKNRKKKFKEFSYTHHPVSLNVSILPNIVQ